MLTCRLRSSVILDICIFLRPILGDATSREGRARGEGGGVLGGLVVTKYHEESSSGGEFI